MFMQLLLQCLLMEDLFGPYFNWATLNKLVRFTLQNAFYKNYSPYRYLK